MTHSPAHLLDPALAEATDPLAGYDPSAEPLQDRLYLPVGVDPHGDICGVVFAHPYPQRKEVLTQRIIRNNNLQDMLWMIETGDRLAAPFQPSPSTSSRPPTSSGAPNATSCTAPVTPPPRSVAARPTMPAAPSPGPPRTTSKTLTTSPRSSNRASPTPPASYPNP